MHVSTDSSSSSGSCSTQLNHHRSKIHHWICNFGNRKKRESECLLVPLGQEEGRISVTFHEERAAWLLVDAVLLPGHFQPQTPWTFPVDTTMLLWRQTNSKLLWGKFTLYLRSPDRWTRLTHSSWTVCWFWQSFFSLSSLILILILFWYWTIADSGGKRKLKYIYQLQ